MAKTITQLPDATAVNGSDELIIQQSGVTKRATKTEVLAGIVNANIDAAAAIDGTKLASDSITNTQIKSDAAIAGTKIAPDFGSQDAVTTGTVTGAKLVPTGTSATGNGMYLPAANAVAISTNGTERIRIGSGGNVGIGTSSPEARLHVAGTNSFRISGGSGDYVATQLINESGVEMQVFANANIGAGLLVTTNHPIDLATNGTTRLQIAASGNVGIGTSSPNAAALVDVTSTTQGFLPPRMTTTERNAISTPPAGLMIYNTTTNKLNVYTTAWQAVTSS